MEFPVVLKDNIETKDFMPIEYTYVVTKMNAHNR